MSVLSVKEMERIERERQQILAYKSSLKYAGELLDSPSLAAVGARVTENWTLGWCGRITSERIEKQLGTRGRLRHGRLRQGELKSLWERHDCKRDVRRGQPLTPTPGPIAQSVSAADS